MSLIQAERDSDDVLRAEDEAIAAAQAGDAPPTALDELARLLDGEPEVHEAAEASSGAGG